MRIKIRTKIIIDIMLFVSGLISMVTGLVLLMLPSGPGTKAGLSSVSSSIFDLSTRGGLRLLHDWSSLILIALILFHLMLNWRIAFRYMKSALRPAD